MEQKTTNYNINENGSYSETRTVTTNPSDGFVHQADTNSASNVKYGEYHKGWEYHKQYSTNDPKVIVPFLVGFMVFLVILTIVAYLINPIFFVVALVISIIFEVALVKEIKMVKENFKKNQNDVRE